MMKTVSASTQLDTIYQSLQSLREFPKVISVAGGSCTGKSSYVVNYLKEKLTGQYTVISQDDFQLGDDFKHKDTSPWKWDDPRQFSLEECKKALLSLKAGNTVTISPFSLKSNRRVGNKTIKPSKYIIFDGLYSLQDGIDTLADVSIYVESPFYARFLRRIFRYTFETNTGPVEIPVSLMINSIYRAHSTFVTQQKSVAKYIVTVPYDIQESLIKIKEEMIYKENLGGKQLYTTNLKNGVVIEVCTSNNLLFLEIYYDKQLIQRATVNKQTLDNLKLINFESM